MFVLSVDDHQLFSEGLRLMIGQIDPKLSFHCARSCGEALDYDAAEIDTILLDFHLPDVVDYEGLTRVRGHFAASKIVVVSGEEAPDIIRETISLGAAGFIPKSSSPEILIAALQLVFAGGVYLPPHVLDQPVSVALPSSDTPASLLSARQLSVLKGAVQGKLNKVIADELNIAEGTVKAHLSAAFKALGVSNRTEAVYAASRLNLQFD